MKILTIFCVVVAFAIHSYCLDYHLSKTITLDNFHEAASIQTLTTDTVAVMEGNLSKLTITALRGDRYQEQVYKVTQFNLVSQPKFNGTSSLIINKGNDIYAKFYEQEQRVVLRQILSNKVLDMYKNVIFSEAGKCPTLTSVRYDQLISKSIGNESECNFYSSGYLSIYEGRYLAYAAKQEILFLNTFNNYEILATFTEPTFNTFSYVDSFYDKTVKDVTTIGAYAELPSTYRMIRKQDGTAQVTFSPLFFNPTSKLSLTSRDQGISTSGDTLYKWHNLDNITQSIEWSDASQSLEGTLPSALSYNQSLIVQTSKNIISVYQMADQNFNLTKLYSVNVSGILAIVKGRITQNGAYYIFNVLKDSGFYVLCQFNLVNQTLLCLNQSRSLASSPEQIQVQIIRDDAFAMPTPSQQQKQIKKTSKYLKATQTIDGMLSFSQQSGQQSNLRTDQQDHTYDCLQWTLYSQSDKIVAMCKNYTSQLIQLHCYRASTMNFLYADNIYVQDIPDISAVLLLPNEYKEENDPSIQDRPMFMLIFKQHNVDIDSDIAVSYRYTAYSDYFLRDAAVFREVSFWNSYAYGGYIASIQFTTEVSKSNQLKIFNFTSGSLIRTVTFDQSVSFLSYLVVGYRNILQVHHVVGLEPTYFFDLKKRPADQEWFKGVYFYNYFRFSQVILDGGQYIIFPKKQVQLYYRHDKTRLVQPLKQVFSISKAPVISAQRMSSEHPAPQVQASLYLKADIDVDWRDCDMIVYISSNKWLNIYRWCENEKSSVKYDLNTNNANFSHWRLEESGTKESIEIIYQHTSNNVARDVVEVRKFENPEQVAWKYNRVAGNEPIQFVNYYQNLYGSYVNVAFKSDFVIKPLEQKLNSSYLEMISVDQVETQSRCNAFAGQSQQSAGVNGIIYYNFLSNINEIFRLHVGSLVEQLRMWGVQIANDSTRTLRLSQDCKKLAVFSNKGQLFVWNISDSSAPQLRFNWAMDPTQVRDVKFAGVNKIVVEKVAGVQIYNVTIDNEESNKVFLELGAFNSKFATSSDGNLYAVANNPLQVQIKTTLGEAVRTFKVPNDASTKDQQITSLSFNSITQQLLVSVSNSKIYVLDPTDCSEPFINVDAVCLCKQNQTASANTCVCENHYIRPTNDTENVCICDTSKFVFQSSQCVCSANSSEVNNDCACHQNFVKEGVHCLCPESFEYSSEKLSCECHNGYIENKKCEACSFPCETCIAGGFNCETYAPLFYVLVIGGPILLIIIIVAVFVVIKKKKSRGDNELLKDDDKD